MTIFNRLLIFASSLVLIFYLLSLLTFIPNFLNSNQFFEPAENENLVMAGFSKKYKKIMSEKTQQGTFELNLNLYEKK